MSLTVPYNDRTEYPGEMFEYKEDPDINTIVSVLLPKMK
jgi:hypothetical protein